MICQRDVTSHLLSGVAFASVLEVSEVDLAAQLIDQTPKHPLALMDETFTPYGLLHRSSTAGTERHWVILLKRGLQYQIVVKLKK